MNKLPWNQEDVARLQDLGLPDLSGKRVLDLDCGRGFFCAFAAYAGASHVCGWSNDAAAIAQAQKLLPECHFSCRDWQELLRDTPDGQMTELHDIIIVPHTIHHGKAIADNIAKLMTHISPWGTLVLETMLVTGQAEQGFFKLGKDPNFYPAMKTLRSMLQSWVWRHVHQVQIRELPLVCDVYHIFHAKPEAILCMNRPFSGKSHVARKLTAENLPLIHGDRLLQEIQRGETWAPEALVELLQRASDIKNFYILIWMICKSGLLNAFVDALDRQAGKRPFIYDGYIPEAFHGTVLAALDSKGYFVTNTDIFSSRVHDRRAIPPEKYEEAFSLFLLKRFKNTLTGKTQD